MTRPAFSFLLRLRAWGEQRPAPVAAAVLLLAFGLYLPTSGYSRLYYDSAGYWWLAGQYYASGKFSLLSAASPLRGYLLPLLLAPFTQIAHTDAEVLAVTRGLGAITAALLWGAALPALWRVTRGPAGLPVSVGRRLLLGAVGWLLWRDYFNFPLTDFPALLLLATGLWGLLRGCSVGPGLLAGASVAAAIILRPVYLAALPAVALLALWPLPGADVLNSKPNRRLAWARLAGAVLGLALVLAPQFYMNAKAFQRYSPFVLGGQEDGSDLYLGQLGWGITNQKYESSIGPDFPSHQMHFGDPAGAALLRSFGREQFETTTEYLALAARHPFEMAALWVRHLFNGLDLQYPTPYIKAVYVPTWGLAWFNYSVLLGGVALLWKRRAHLNAPRTLTLAAVLLPCLASIPVAMECRFLLPLHTLLCAALVYGARPGQWWREATKRQRLGLGIIYLVVIIGCFMVSAAMQRQLEPGGRRLFEWQEKGPERW